MQLKGTTGTSRKVIKWTLADKIAVYRAVRIDKVSPKAAFEAIGVSKEVELPESYTKFPHSHIWRFANDFSKAIEKKNTVVITALREAGLLDE